MGLAEDKATLAKLYVTRDKLAEQLNVQLQAPDGQGSVVRQDLEKVQKLIDNLEGKVAAAEGGGFSQVVGTFGRFGGR